MLVIIKPQLFIGSGMKSALFYPQMIGSDSFTCKAADSRARFCLLVDFFRELSNRAFYTDLRYVLCLCHHVRLKEDIPLCINQKLHLITQKKEIKLFLRMVTSLLKHASCARMCLV